MYTKEISISTLDEAKAFVNMTGKYMGLKIFLENNNYKIDAHSIMGVISLDMSHPITCEIEGEVPEEFYTDIEPFLVEKN